MLVEFVGSGWSGGVVGFEDVGGWGGGCYGWFGWLSGFLYDVGGD